MCRLYAFRSNHPTRLKCSLVLAQNALMLQSVAETYAATLNATKAMSCCFS